MVYTKLCLQKRSSLQCDSRELCGHSDDDELADAQQLYGQNGGLPGIGEIHLARVEEDGFGGVAGHLLSRRIVKDIPN